MRIALSNSIDCLAVIGQGEQLPGIRLVGTWYGTEGRTMDLGTQVHYTITDTEGNTEARVYDPATGGVVVYGQNNRTISDTINAEPYTLDFTLYVAETFTVTTTTNQFSFLAADIGNTSKISAELAGGTWSETLPSTVVTEAIEAVYTGTFTPPEGDYELTYTLTDPNGVKFDSDGTIVQRWAPHVFIVGYRVDGGVWLKDVQNPAPIAGYESIDLQYCKGYNVLTNPDGSPQYDVNGSIQTLGGGLLEEELAVAFDKGENTFVIGNIDDNFSNSKSTWPFVITRIPTVKWDGLTTIDYETYKTDESGNSSYNGVDSVIVDEGLTSEITVTPIEAPYNFSLPYGTKTIGYSYTYPEGGSNSGTQEIEYQEFNVPKILTLAGRDVSAGQIPKLSTLNDIWVDWLDSTNTPQSDLETVVPHETATDVLVTREVTATATYSHKSGLPVPTLLYYRDDLGIRVDFNGTYEIPDTVTDDPITFGWSITNGNVVGEVEQSEFTQSLTVDSANDVIMPTFTDDWGNEATLASRTQGVQYGQASAGLYASPPTQIGNGFTIGSNNPSSLARLTDSRIVFSGGNNLKIFDWDGTDWAQVGNTYSVGQTGPLSAISSTRFAFGSRGNDDIQMYEFDGTDITTVGNPLVLGSIGGTFMCTIGANRIVALNGSSGFVVCDFDGTDWTQVGNAYTSDGSVLGSCCIGTSGAFIGATTNGFGYYTFNGTDIVRIGNFYSLSLSEVSISNLLNDDIVVIADSYDLWNTFRFDGTDFQNVSTPQDVYLDTNLPSSCKMYDNGSNEAVVATIEKYGVPMRTYKFTTS